MTTSSSRPSIRWSRVVIYALLVVAAAFYLLPVYVLLVTGLKSFQEVSLARMASSSPAGRRCSPSS